MLSEEQQVSTGNGVPDFLRRSKGDDAPATTPTTDQDWAAAEPATSNVTDIKSAGRGRGRKAQEDPAKDKAKANAEAVFTKPEPTAKEERAAAPRVVPATDNRLLYGYVRDIVALTAKKDEAVKKIRDRRKTAKADGIDLAAADVIIREMRLSPDEIIETQNVINSYRSAMRLPAYQPLELEGAVSRTPEEQLSYIELEGERAGLRGASQSDCPHDVDTEAGARWMTGYDRGQEMVRETFRKTLARNNKAKPADADQE